MEVNLEKAVKKLILVISGPSGSGKTSLLKILPEEEFYFSVSHTTRPPRKREIHGKDYYFVSEEEFVKMIKNNEFIEWVKTYEHYYGTSKGEIQKALSQDKHLVLDIEVIGARNIKKLLGELVTTVFIIPPSLEVLKDRLKKRGTENEEELQKRLERARFEINFLPWFDYVIINDELQRAKETFLSIIKSELARPFRQNLDSIFKSSHD